MANKHGDFIWYELMTGDLTASAAFYGAVLDWTFPPAKSEPDDYLEIQAGDEFVGGLLRLTPEMTAGGAHPAWIGYIAVDDVDASVALIETAGGRTHLPARDMEGVGRFAMVADPQGAPFYVMKSASDETSNSFAYDMPRIGHCAWNELSTTDPSAAVEFYTGLFGWRQEGDMDMGPMGKYQFLYHGPGMIGAIMPKMPQMPVPFWTYYFRVPDVDVAVDTIKANGGTILQEPIEIPGGDFSMNALDPQGASFALVGARK
jgi:predicted enzyme related to lactoylglutathione lyase